MDYKFDIYDITNPGKPCLLASEASQSEALLTIEKIKKQFPGKRLVIKPEYNTKAGSL